MRSPLNRLLSLLALCCLAARGGTISYSDSGTFASSTPGSAFIVPGETWAFAFQADTNPTILQSTSVSFDLPFSAFTYSLDNSPVALTPTVIRFFSSAVNGGWIICFDGTSPCTDGLAAEAPQMYSGTTFRPTLLPGAFTSSFFVAFENTTLLYQQPNTTVQATTATPEPSTLFSLTAALVILGVGRICWRRKRV